MPLKTLLQCANDESSKMLAVNFMDHFDYLLGLAGHDRREIEHHLSSITFPEIGWWTDISVALHYVSLTKQSLNTSI